MCDLSMQALAVHDIHCHAVLTRVFRFTHNSNCTAAASCILYAYKRSTSHVRQKHKLHITMVQTNRSIRRPCGHMTHAQAASWAALAAAQQIHRCSRTAHVSPMLTETDLTFKARHRPPVLPAAQFHARPAAVTTHLPTFCRSQSPCEPVKPARTSPQSDCKESLTAVP